MQNVEGKNVKREAEKMGQHGYLPQSQLAL